MDSIVLLRIEGLHVRTVQRTGLKIRHKGHDIETGTIVATLDDSAPGPTNIGLLNVDAGTIHLRWAVVVGLPFMADAMAGGFIGRDESAALKVSFEEVGQMLENGQGFDAKGTGQIGPGSLLSQAKILIQNNGMRTPGRPRVDRALAGGDAVRCTLVPESYLDVALPKSLGGGTHRLNITGGFFLVPAMTLGRLERTKRSRR